MKKLYFLFLMSLSFAISAQSSDTNGGATNVGITGDLNGVYINEFHYDNDGGDVGEFIEVAGPAGTDLSIYTLTLYNGSATQLKVYGTPLVLSGTIDDEGSGVGSVTFSISGIQNGSPDGLALSYTTNSDVQFLSYEGSFTPVDGPAAGTPSVDIGVEESWPYPGESLEYDEATMAWGISYTATAGNFAQGAILSTKENQIDGFDLYPNPTSSAFVNISSDNRSPMKISVYDILGKQVIERTVTNNRLNVSNLNTGVYILRAQQDNAFTTRKLVIN